MKVNGGSGYLLIIAIYLTSAIFFGRKAATERIISGLARTTNCTNVFLTLSISLSDGDKRQKTKRQNEFAENEMTLVSSGAPENNLEEACAILLFASSYDFEHTCTPPPSRVCAARFTIGARSFSRPRLDKIGKFLDTDAFDASERGSESSAESRHRIDAGIYARKEEQRRGFHVSHVERIEPTPGQSNAIGEIRVINGESISSPDMERRRNEDRQTRARNGTRISCLVAHIAVDVFPNAAAPICLSGEEVDRSALQPSNRDDKSI